MRRSVPMTSSRTIAALALAVSGAALAVPGAKTDTAAREAEALLREAAQAERTDCEGAYARYQQAGAKVPAVLDKARAAQITSIVSNKLDKLEECFSSCQPTERQRSLFESAKAGGDAGEVKRTTTILRRLLVGKSAKCQFWAGVRTYLKGTGGLDEADDKVDPCTVTADVQKEMDDARAAARRERASLDGFDVMKTKLASKLPEVLALYREMDQTREKVIGLREEFIDCDKIYHPLMTDSSQLRSAYEHAQDLIFSTFQNQVSALSRKVRAFHAEMAEKDKQLLGAVSEKERLKTDFEALSKFNEELYNDLFNLAGAEAVSFSVNVEGRRVEQPLEDIQALVSDQKKVMETLQTKYPEYFADGVNVEALKRKKLVLEKVGQMLGRYEKQPNHRPANARAVAEVEATVQMMDKALGAPGEKGAVEKPAVAESGTSSAVPWLVVVGGLLLAVGLAIARFKMSS